MTGRRLLLFAILAALGPPSTVAAQGFKGSVRTYVSYLQVRGLALDSVPDDAVSGNGPNRVLDDGTRVTCADEYCRYFRSGDVLGVAPFLVDLQGTAWTGIEGLSAYAQIRFREPLGGEELWPRSSEQFEALAAYLEYRRSFFRLKGGRIWLTTALGFYNYDGGSLNFRGPSQFDVDLYGGVSILRGLNQYHPTDLISSVEPLGPEDKANIFGVHARWNPFQALSAAFTYQRENVQNSADLYSERIAGSARILIHRATVDLELKYDLAAETTNLLLLRLGAPLFAGLRGSAEYRKYVPYFDLWTIWGAFAPVGFDEGRARLDWMAPSGSTSLRAYGSYRQYGDAELSESQPYAIDDRSWRIAAGGRFTLMENTVLDGEYRYDTGFGASRSGGDLSVQRFFGQNLFLALRGTAFETFSEFTVGSGTVYGGGLQGGMPLGPATIQVNAMFYKQIQNDRPSLLDLNQTRISLILEIPLGGDPGMGGRGNR